MKAESAICSMKGKFLKSGMGVICLVSASAWVFHAKNQSDSDADQRLIAHGNHSVELRRYYRSAAHPAVSSEDESSPVPRALVLPTGSVDEKSVNASVAQSSTSHGLDGHRPPLQISDDDILTRGGVLPAIPIPSAAGDKGKGPRSIKAAEWKGASNLLVNALRSGDRFEVNHDQLMEFLRGKDLLGWPEGSRNWIGDELMTALRQDMPQSAFEDLKSIAEDSNAPAAMRDYSVQHISHLMTNGTIGPEGADYIWQTLKKNDPQTLSTALISLHRLSELVPDLVAAKQVQAAAERLKESPDERTRITVESILKK